MYTKALEILKALLTERQGFLQGRYFYTDGRDCPFRDVLFYLLPTLRYLPLEPDGEFPYVLTPIGTLREELQLEEFFKAIDGDLAALDLTFVEACALQEYQDFCYQGYNPRFVYGQVIKFLEAKVAKS